MVPRQLLCVHVRQPQQRAGNPGRSYGCWRLCPGCKPCALQRRYVFEIPYWPPLLLFCHTHPTRCNRMFWQRRRLCLMIVVHLWHVNGCVCRVEIPYPRSSFLSGNIARRIRIVLLEYTSEQCKWVRCHHFTTEACFNHEC